MIFLFQTNVKHFLQGQASIKSYKRKHLGTKVQYIFVFISTFIVHICIYFDFYLFPDVFVCFCSIFAPRSRLSLKSDYSLRRQAERIYHFAFFTKDRWMGGWMNGWMVHFNQIKNTKTHLKHSRTYWILHLYIADAPCFNFIKSS